MEYDVTNRNLYYIGNYNLLFTQRNEQEELKNFNSENYNEQMVKLMAL